MTDRKPEEIEREIEAERNALENSIEQLQAQFSPDALVNQATAYFKTHGNELAQSVGRTARDNPIPLALTGIGLAWLMASTKPRNDVPAPATDAGMKAPARSRAASTAQRTDVSQHVREPEWMRGETTMTDNQEKTWSTVQTRAANAADRVKDKVAELRARIDEGTQDMPEAAKARVRQARIAAVEAQEHIERQAAALASRARKTSENNPLLIGALAFAAGAAFAAALPRTSTENRLVGAHRDRLFDEADRVFREEREKLKSVAQATVSEGKAVIRDAISGEGTKVDGGSAVSRIKSAAAAEARRENLGRA